MPRTLGRLVVYRGELGEYLSASCGVLDQVAEQLQKRIEARRRCGLLLHTCQQTNGPRDRMQWTGLLVWRTLKDQHLLWRERESVADRPNRSGLADPWLTRNERDLALPGPGAIEQTFQQADL